MVKWLISIFSVFFITLQVQAFEECMIMANGKLTDISIVDDAIVEINSLITIMNEKNILVVSPLKTGKTKVSVIKNNKDRIIFNIEVLENKTIIDKVEGFEILALDEPSESFELDEPPVGFELDEPPFLNGENN